MSKFEVVSYYADKEISLPVRATAGSAGYDFEAAEDIIIPSMYNLMDEMEGYVAEKLPYPLDELKTITKGMKLQPTLIPTGIKCKLDDGYYLEISARSSIPLNHWMILANGEGIIDTDYYNNPGNEGAIMFQYINLSPVDIYVKKGDKIGQGIIKKYEVTEDDAATGVREGGFGSTGGSHGNLTK